MTTRQAQRQYRVVCDLLHSGTQDEWCAPTSEIDAYLEALSDVERLRDWGYEVSKAQGGNVWSAWWPGSDIHLVIRLEEEVF